MYTNVNKLLANIFVATQKIRYLKVSCCGVNYLYIKDYLAILIGMLENQQTILASEIANATHNIPGKVSELLALANIEEEIFDRVPTGKALKIIHFDLGILKQDIDLILANNVNIALKHMLEDFYCQYLSYQKDIEKALMSNDSRYSCKTHTVSEGFYSY